MLFNRIIGSCLVAITILLAVTILRPIFSPDAARAQTHYEYQLVKVEERGSAAPADTVTKLTKQGWEPVSMSFYGDYSRPAGYLLFRR
jgi:hypothetical protein